MTPVDADATLVGIDVPIDLDNCEREPIHIPGSVQPRGVLLAVREVGLTVTQVSANIEDQLGIGVDAALGYPLSDVIGRAAVAVVERAISVFGDLRERNPISILITVDGHPLEFDAILHRAPSGTLVIELERAEGPRPFSFPNTYLAVRGTVAELNQAAELDELYGITARAVRTLTGFDRVMVYRYDEEFNGEVVAEERRSDLVSFLGLHYPASDIPAQARKLYEKNWLRLISDVDCRPAHLVPRIEPDTDAPLDLTFATLRSVSPIHIQYLQNMGVRASMSISLLRHGVLWGLIACHHYSGPHAPPYGVRAAAEFLGSTLSLRLVNRAERDSLGQEREARSVLLALSAAMRDESRLMADSMLGSPSLLDLVPGDGLTISIGGELTTQGVVPGPDGIEAVAQWARRTNGDDLASTDSLARSAPELGISPDVACGVLAVQLPDGQFILWFRSEAPHTVDWGGDPATKAVAAPDGSGVRLGPRTSFARWHEVVHLRSRPWSPEELHLAAELRGQAVETLYVLAERDLRHAEALQRSLLPSFLPIVPGWTVSAHYEPAEGGQIGGDWYDALDLSGDHFAVVLGDVAGHGVRAAGVMAQLRNALRAHLLETGSPTDALSRLSGFATAFLPDAFATVFVACVDAQTGHVRAASAGHLSPYLVFEDEPAALVPMRISPPLGVTGATYSATEFSIPAGSNLVLFSDGLIERRTEHIETGLVRLAGALHALGPGLTAAEVPPSVMTPGAEDDTTVVSVHRDARGSTETL